MRKLITVLLALVMALAVLPATIWAENDAVATIGQSEYSTLGEAIAAATDGQTIELKDNIDISKDGKLTADGYLKVEKDITIDLGGKKLSNPNGGGFDMYADLTLKNGSMETLKWAAWVQSGAALVVEKDVSIKATSQLSTHGGITVAETGSSVTVFGKVESVGTAVSGIGNAKDGGVTINIEEGAVLTSTEGAGIYYPNTAELNIKGGTITGVTGVYVKSGKTTVTGGTIIGTGNKADYKFNNNGYDSTGNAFVVDKCNYPGGDPTVKIEGGTFKGVNANAVGSYTGNNATEALTGFITGGSFTDLASPFKYAADKATIKMAADVKTTEQLEVTSGKDITLDMAGKTIEYTGSTELTAGVIAVHNGAGLTVTGNGTIKSGDNAYAAVTVTVKGDDASKPAKLTINNGTLEGKYYAIAGNGTRNNTEITINGGKLVTDLGAAIYHPQDGKLTINNGELIGFNTAVEIRSGNLIVHDGSFTATAKPTDVEGNGNGTTTAGAAIAIAQHNTKKPIDVTINGGIFNGEHALYESNPQNNEEEFIKQVTLAVKGGTFNGLIYSKDLTGFVTGGTFTTNPSQYIDTSNQYDITFVNETRLYTVTKSEADKPAEVKVVASTNGEDSGELISAEIPMAAVDENKDLTVADEEGKISVRFNESAVNSIKGEDEGTLNIEIKTGTTASDENKAALEEAMKDKKEGSALVVSLNMTKTIDKELVPVFTEEVEGATAIVTIPYALQDGEKLVVYYLNDGTLKELGEDVVKYEDGFVILTLEHFSEYVLTTVAAPSVDPGENPGENPGDTKPGDTKPGDTKPGEGKSDAPKTFDAGIAVYGVTAILSVTGMAWVGLKKRK